MCSASGVSGGSGGGSGGSPSFEAKGGKSSNETLGVSSNGGITSSVQANAGSSTINATGASDQLTQQQIQAEVQSILAGEPAAAPDASDAQTHLAAEAQARSVLAQRGRSSTFVGGQSLTGSGPQAVKSVLGG